MKTLARTLVLMVLAGALAACGLGSSPAATAPSGGADSASDLLSRGLQAHNAGKLDEATSLYYQTLAKDPKNKFAFFNLGEIAHRQNRLVAAESLYRLALEQDANMTQALYNLAIVRQAANDLPEARDLYRKLVGIEPNNAAAHYNLGNVLRGLGDTAGANVEFATAQRLDPRLVPPSGSPRPSPTR